jgi:large subunit ribosomal protein L31
MKTEIHPAYELVTVHCSCGNDFQTRSTKGGDISVEICAECHPFYTGKQKLMDTGGRVERFRRRAAQAQAAAAAKPAAPAARPAAASAPVTPVAAEPADEPDAPSAAAEPAAPEDQA